MAKGVLVVPAGSPVRGRIRRMERYTEPFPYFVVGLEFIEIEVQGIRRFFYADLVAIDPAPGVATTLTTKDATITTDNVLGTATRQTKESLSLFSLPGVAAFFFKGSTLALPADFRTVWKTRSLKP